jgi:hypothetical protein
MDSFYTIHIYLDAVKFTARRVITPDLTITLPVGVIYDTILVTRDKLPVVYTVSGKRDERLELEHITDHPTNPATITFFTENVKWSADHKFLINTDKPEASVSRFEIEIQNDSMHLLKAEKIFLVNQAFKEHSSRHGYRMKAYGNTEMVPMARGAPTESGSALLPTSSKVYPINLTKLHPGMTRFSIDGLLKFMSSSFKFPIGRMGSRIPAEFNVTVKATEDIPAGSIIMYRGAFDSFPFLGQAHVEPFTAEQKRDIAISITPTLLADVVVKEAVIEETKATTVRRVVITITVTNYDTVDRLLAFLLPIESHMLTDSFESNGSWEAVDGNYEWYGLAHRKLDAKSPPEKTERKISYDYWTERR